MFNDLRDPPHNLKPSVNQIRVADEIEFLLHPVVQEVYDLIRVLRPKAEAWDSRQIGRSNLYAVEICGLVRALAEAGVFAPPPPITMARPHDLQFTEELLTLRAEVADLRRRNEQLLDIVNLATPNAPHR
jgi:hypothetical protein